MVCVVCLAIFLWCQASCQSNGINVEEQEVNPDDLSLGSDTVSSGITLVVN